jgi:large subunit ribosomal protein L13
MAITIDATNLILGRLATHAAKKALLGEKVTVINCENAVLSGSKAQLVERYQNRISRGIPLKGPYFPRTPDRIVRRTIRGMLPYKKERGREAYERIMCYIGTPVKLEGQTETLKQADAAKLPTLKRVTVGEIAKIIGSKV